MELFLQIAILVAVAFIIKYIISSIRNIKNVNTLFISLKNIEWKKKKINPKQLIDKLEQADYFKYTDPKDLTNAIQQVIDGYHPKGSFPIAWNEETNLSVDMRGHFCDGEDVFEQGGFIDILEELKLHFKAFGLKVDITQHYEEWDNKKGLNHTITINNTKHIIFENYDGDWGWGIAPRRLAEILNFELEKQGIKERVYLSLGGNEGMIHFFTEEQYKIIDETLIDDSAKPLTVEEWSNLNGLE